MASAPPVIDDPNAGDPPSPPAPPAPPAPPGDPNPADPPTPANDDWRARIAGDDPDLAKYLGRHASEAAFAKEAKQNLADIRSGKFLKPLGDDPSETEVAAYRKAMAIPEKPEGYYEKLADGLVVGDDDKPFVDKFLNEMHGAHAPPTVTNAALKAYYAIVEEQSAAAADAEKTAKTASEDALREEWGQDYRRNVNAVSSFLDTLPEPVKEALSQGYGPDGVSLANNADVIKWLAAQALEANPLHTVVPGAGANQAQAIDDEIAALEKFMREDRKAYNADAGKQARLRELYGAREKLGGKK